MRTRPVYRYSRLAGGALSYGVRGRLVLTFLVTVPPLWLFLSAGAFGVLGFCLWVFVVLPVLLRDVWRRTRVLVEPARDVDFVPPAREPGQEPPDGYVGPRHPGQPRW